MGCTQEGREGRGILGVIAGSLAFIFERSWKMLETSRTEFFLPVLRTERQQISLLSLGRAEMQLAELQVS